MNSSEITSIFDKQAAHYDAQWERSAAIRNGLYYILDALFIDLPADARILSVGTGTGTELAHLAAKHPGWRFTAVEPSGAMLDECRKRATFHAPQPVAKAPNSYTGLTEWPPING